MDSIRPEKPTDAAGIRRVLDGAFGRTAEGTAVEALRARRALVLSLAALREDMIVGVSQFTEAHLDLTLEPKWLEPAVEIPAVAPAKPAAAPAATPPSRSRSRARRAEPAVPWVSLEEEFDRERREREMEEVLEAARIASKTKAPAVAPVVAPISAATRAPRFVVLAPVAVLPKLQRRGIGTRLIEAGFGHLARMHSEAVFVLGDPAYYGRFGFRSTHEFDIACELPVNEDVFQVRELRPGALEGVKGVVRFEPELRELD